MANPAMALPIADELLANRNHTPYFRMRALNCLGHAKVTAGDMAGAINAANEAYTLLNKNPLTQEQRPLMLDDVADLYFMAGDASRASRLFQEGYGLSKDNPSMAQAQIKALSGLGGLYLEVLSDPKTALSYTQRAYELSLKSGHEDIYLDYDYVMILHALERYDEAMPVIDRILEKIAHDQRYTGVFYRAQFCRAESLFHDKHYETAFRLITSVIAAQHKLPDMAGETNSLRLLGRIQIEVGQYRAAIASGEQLVRTGIALHDKRIESDGLHLQADAYGKLDELKPANDAMQHAFELDRQIMQETNQQNVAFFEAQMRDEEIRSQNRLLATQLQLNQLKERRANLIRNLILASLFLVIFFSIGIVVYQRKTSQQLRLLSTTDPLTGLLNRRGVTQALSSQTPSPEYGERSAAIFLIDADHFKSINDKFGHAAGDLVLKELAVRILDAVRSDDLVARWGGEEFLVCAWNVTEQEASHLAARLCSSIAAKPLHLPDAASLTISISVGFVFHPFFPGKSPIRWRDSIRLADRALYAAKHSGRNCWVGLKGRTALPYKSTKELHENLAEAVEKEWVSAFSDRRIHWNAATRGTADVDYVERV